MSMKQGPGGKRKYAVGLDNLCKRPRLEVLDVQEIEPGQNSSSASTEIDRKSKADVADSELYAADLPTGSQYTSNTGILVQQAESPGYNHHPVHSRHTGSPFDRADSREEAAPETSHDVPTIPYFLLDKTANKHEERPLELTLQKPSQASIPPKKTACVAPFPNTIQPKTSTPQESFPNLMQAEAVQETSSDSSPQTSGEMVVPQQTSDSLQGANGNTREEDIITLRKDVANIKFETSNHEKRIQQLEEQNISKTAEILQLQSEITAKDNQIVALENHVKELQQELEKSHSNEKDLKQTLRDEKELVQALQKERDALQKKLQQVEEQSEQIEKQPIEDVDAVSNAQPSGLEKESVCDEDTLNPKMWMLGEKLGRGSFGEVYICHHKVHNKLAVKVMDVEKSRDEAKIVDLFKKEVSALKKVQKHNRIVAYIDTDTDVTTSGVMKLYIFMEYVPGGTLRQYIQKNGGMDLLHARKCTRQLLEGVAHLHENKIVHRDIKGANILQDLNGNIKLGDFGCAKTLENISIDGKMSHEQGTICWRAPETVKPPLQYTFKSDIWSIGATVIELVTGKYPYSPYEPCAVIWILGAEGTGFKTPYEVCKIPDPDPDMVTFLSHCFHREPSERLSAQDLLQKTKFCCI